MGQSPVQSRPTLSFPLSRWFADHVLLRLDSVLQRLRSDDDPCESLAGQDAIPEPVGQLSQRPPAGAVRRGDQLEVEGL